ncbi:diguanylate cyclase [bacterium]|nr:diguanylate cyclase [candidate division CSSED10-310 bacterium]
MGNKDSLTGLYNRSRLARLKSMFRKRQQGKEWSIMMIDIDHFKLINDIYGHLSGDEVLKKLATILGMQIRRNDIALRFGGDEFMCVFPMTKMASAVSIGERIITQLKKEMFPHGIRVSLSIGISESCHSDTDLDAVIERSDRSLYRAKELGRGQISTDHIKEDIQTRKPLSFSYFIGRQANLKELKQLLDQSLSEGARFAIIRGEAGVGKSRLASELKQYAIFKRCSIFESGIYEFGEVEPYTVIIEPIKKIIDNLALPERLQLEKSLGVVHPATAELLPQLESIAGEDTLFFREERVKFRIYDDISKILNILTQINPVLFIIDDIQWIALPDRELLNYIIRNAQNARILYVATIRTSEKQSNEVFDYFNKIRTNMPLLDILLENFTEQETNNLVMFALKDPNIPPDLLKMIHRQSGGNPFFIRELLNSLHQSDSISPDPSGGWSYYIRSDVELPESLSQLIASRLKPLRELSRKLLRIASLSSSHFSLELLREISGEDDVAIAEALEEPLQAGLIQDIDSGGSSVLTFNFTHDTVRSYLHREFPVSIRRIYHARIAQFYEARSPSGSDDIISTVAYHYNESGIVSKAREYALMAGKRSERLKAYREAIRWFEIFLSYKPDDVVNKSIMFDVYKVLGELYALTGRGLQAQETLIKAFQAAETAEQKTSLYLVQGNNFQRMSKYQEARKFFNLAYEHTNDPMRQGDILGALAFLDYLEGETSNAVSKLNEIEILIEHIDNSSLGFDRIRASYLTTRGIVEQFIHPDSGNTQYHQEAINLFKKHGDILGESTVLNNLADVYIRIGEYEKTLDVLKQSEQICSKLDDALGQAIAWYNLAETYLEINEKSLALEYFERYLEANNRIQNRLGIGYGKLGLGALKMQENEYSVAISLLSEAVDVFAAVGAKKLLITAKSHLIEASIHNQNFEVAQSLLDDLNELKLSDLEYDIRSMIDFVNGLKIHVMNKKDDAIIENRAYKLFRRAIDSRHNLILSDLIKRSYYYCLSSLRLKRQTTCKKILKECLNILEERLDRIESQRIRQNIYGLRYVDLILALATKMRLELKETLMQFGET